MTKDEILNMESGREMDALVAEYVFGMDLKGNKPELPIRAIGCENYSTSVDDAWEVVNKMRGKYHWRIQSPFVDGEPWWAGLTPKGVTGWNGRPDFEASGRVFALAICRAALLAVLDPTNAPAS